jgi:hypothetical protein
MDTTTTKQLKTGQQVLVQDQQYEVVAVSRWASQALTYDVILSDATGQRFSMVKGHSHRWQLAPDADAARQRVEDIGKAIDQQADALWDLGCHASVIDACMENASDEGLSEADNAYWPTVLSQLLGELDSFGLVIHADNSISVR